MDVTKTAPKGSSHKDAWRLPYFIEVDVNGCEHCSGGRMWTVVGPGDIGIGQSWGDEEHAQDIADLMNMAFDAGRESDEKEVELYRSQLNDANHRVAELQEQLHSALSETAAPAYHIDIVFDGPPGPEAGRFVEVEDNAGRSLKFGEWVHRPDGYWVLRFTAAPQPNSAASQLEKKEV